MMNKMCVSFLLCGILAIVIVPMASSQNLFNCPSKVNEAFRGECLKHLEERLELIRKAEDEVDKKAPTMFNCCYYQEFKHCVIQQSRDACGGSIVQYLDSLLSNTYKALNSKCEDYAYYSPQCIFVVWFNLIVFGSIVLAILLVGCCIGACLCKRK